MTLNGRVPVFMAHQVTSRVSVPAPDLLLRGSQDLMTLPSAVTIDQRSYGVHHAMPSTEVNAEPDCAWISLTAGPVDQWRITTKAALEESDIDLTPDDIPSWYRSRQRALDELLTIAHLRGYDTVDFSIRWGYHRRYRLIFPERFTCSQCHTGECRPH